MAEGVDGAAAICCFMTSDYFVSYFTIVFLAIATSDRSLLPCRGWQLRQSVNYKRPDNKFVGTVFVRIPEQ